MWYLVNSRAFEIKNDAFVVNSWAPPTDDIQPSLLMNDRIRWNAIYSKVFKEDIEAADLPKIDAIEPFHVREGKTLLYFINPEKGREQESIHKSCLVINVIFGKTAFFLTGDTIKDVLKTKDWSSVRDRCEQPYVCDKYFLKISHHGSDTGTDDELLRLCQPNLAFISTNGRKYGFPKQTVIDALDNSMVRYLISVREGTDVVYRSDGNNIQRVCIDDIDRLL
jgi:hypothetical protein